MLDRDASAAISSASCAGNAANPDRVSVVAPVFFPGGVADPGGRAGYVADSGAIVAVDLVSGRPLWRTDRAWRPLAVVGERLAAAGLVDGRANALRIVLLDLGREGEPILISGPVVFPEWISVARPRESFWFTAHVEGGRLLLAWEARAQYSGGAAPSSQIQQEAARQAEGITAINLDSGEVRPLLRDEPAVHDQPARAPRPPIDSQDLAEPWPAGTKLARLIWVVDDGEQSLWLETSDPSSGETGTVELTRGGGLVAQVTPEGSFLFVHREQAPPTLGDWSVFSAETGERVSTLSYEPGARCPAVLGPRAYYLVEQLPGQAAGEGAALSRTLKARELGTDRLVWQLPLGERPTFKAPPLRQ